MTFDEMKNVITQYRKILKMGLRTHYVHLDLIRLQNISEKYFDCFESVCEFLISKKLKPKLTQRYLSYDNHHEHVNEVHLIVADILKSIEKLQNQNQIEEIIQKLDKIEFRLNGIRHNLRTEDYYNNLSVD